MNIKVKALLLSLVYVALPFVFVYATFKYPILILFLALAFIVWLVYNKVLDDLTKDHHKKNGYTINEINKEFGEPK